MRTICALLFACFVVACSGDVTSDKGSALWTVAAAPALDFDTESDPMASLGDVNGVARALHA